jgi:hypothetical protein
MGWQNDTEKLKRRDHRTIDTKTQIETKKKRTRNDEKNLKWTIKRITKTANENEN